MELSVEKIVHHKSLEVHLGELGLTLQLRRTILVLWRLTPVMSFSLELSRLTQALEAFSLACRLSLFIM
jgi:hypothetical protein